MFDHWTFCPPWHGIIACVLTDSNPCRAAHVPPCTFMNDPAQSAALLLKLYELRTETTLRQARAWFAFEFHPSSAKDVLAAWLGPGHESAPYRMVTTYWDMAASLVLDGAIPAPMFNEANTEHFALVAKMRPFLPEVRAATSFPDYLSHVERVVDLAPNAEERVAIFARYMTRQKSLAAEGKQRSAFPAAHRSPP